MHVFTRAGYSTHHRLIRPSTHDGARRDEDGKVSRGIPNMWWQYNDVPVRIRVDGMTEKPCRKASPRYRVPDQEKIDSVRSGGEPVVVGLDEDDHKEVGSIRYLMTMTIDWLDQ